MTWTFSAAVTSANVAPVIADHDDPSDDCSIRPASAVPVKSPTTWTAKHGPSAASMSIGGPVGELVFVSGYRPEATRAAEPRSLSAVDMGTPSRWGWVVGCDRPLSNPSPARGGALAPFPRREGGW